MLHQYWNKKLDKACRCIVWVRKFLVGIQLQQNPLCIGHVAVCRAVSENESE